MRQMNGAANKKIGPSGKGSALAVVKPPPPGAGMVQKFFNREKRENHLRRGAANKKMVRRARALPLPW
jgi:hypothetical protein